MSFVLKQSSSYSWPVKVDLPEDGKLRRHTFEAEFKNISQTRFQEMIDQSSAGEINDVDVCREVVLGWSGILDDKGEEMPFIKAKFDELLDVLGIPTAIAAAFIDSRMGAKRKN
tara:strand:- start:2060 stop:2401 length:342 start_codon:yes stop_codon:yes gene_type:complete